MDMAAWLTDSIIKPTYSDLRLIVIGLDTQDEKGQLDLVIEKGKTYLTTNELRVMDNAEPLGFWVSAEKYKGLSDEDKEKFDTNPYNWPSDSPKTSYIQTFNSAKQQEAMMQQQAGGQDDGQGGDEQDQGDGNPWDENYDDGNDENANPWGQGGDDKQQEQQGMQKSRREPKRDVKYLKITIE